MVGSRRLYFKSGITRSKSQQSKWNLFSSERGRFRGFFCRPGIVFFFHSICQLWNAQWQLPGLLHFGLSCPKFSGNCAICLHRAGLLPVKCRQWYFWIPLCWDGQVALCIGNGPTKYGRNLFPYAYRFKWLSGKFQCRCDSLTLT